MVVGAPDGNPLRAFSAGQSFIEKRIVSSSRLFSWLCQVQGRMTKMSLRPFEALAVDDRRAFALEHLVDRRAHVAVALGLQLWREQLQLAGERGEGRAASQGMGVGEQKAVGGVALDLPRLQRLERSLLEGIVSYGRRCRMATIPATTSSIFSAFRWPTAYNTIRSSAVKSRLGLTLLACLRPPASKSSSPGETA